MAIKTVPGIAFKGYSSPNYTPVPDELFDEQLPSLSGAELKVILYIIRRTFGFKKNSDNISLNQLLNGITTREKEILNRGTGLSKKTLLETIKNLVRKSLILTERRRSEERGDEPTTYRLNIIKNNIENKDSPRGVKSIPGGVVKSIPGPSDKKYTTQETVLQQTDIQIRNSNSRLQVNEPKDNKGYTQFHAIGDLLKKEVGNKVIKIKGIPENLKASIDEISKEFNDRRNLRSNLTHVINIYQESKKSPERFSSHLYEARSITKQQASVKKRMPYFFSVLKDLINGANSGNIIKA